MSEPCLSKKPTPPTKPFLTRAEIASMLCVSIRQVRKNEKRWGLDKARRDLNHSCVRYKSSIVWNILLGRGWV